MKAVKTTREVKNGEEFFANYGYDIDSSAVPKWYKKLLIKV